MRHRVKSRIQTEVSRDGVWATVGCAVNLNFGAVTVITLHMCVKQSGNSTFQDIRKEFEGSDGEKKKVKSLHQVFLDGV